MPAGKALALMTDEMAPTPCSRTGFHISSISVWYDLDVFVGAAVLMAMLHVVLVVVPAVIPSDLRR